MNLILIQPHEHSRTDTGAVDLPPDDARAAHIIDHLKKKTGDLVSVGLVDDGGGRTGQAVVLHRQGGGVRLVTKPNTMRPSRDGPDITLVLAAPFPARLRYLWPVITSFAAVTRVVVVRGQLSNPEFCESTALRPSVYQPLIEKGMSQGGRTRPVKVDVCLQPDAISRQSFERLGLVGDAADGAARVFLDCGDEDATPPPARDVVLDACGHKNGGKPSAILAVGPERGWTDEEAKVFVRECGFRAATLGSSILRVDTAVVAGLGVVGAALDECRNADAGVAECKRRRQKSPGKETLA